MISAGFDLDGTLIHTKPLIVKALSEKGHVVTGNQNFMFDFKDGTEPPRDFQWDLFFYRLFTERWQEIKPIDGAYEFLSNVVYYGLDEVVRVSTSRPDGALMHYACMQTLRSNFPDIDFSVDVCGSGSDKHKYLSGYRIYFDDRRQTAKKLFNKGFLVFMRNTEYNTIQAGSPYAKYTHYVGDLSAMPKSGIITYDSFEQLLRCGIHRFITRDIF